MQISRSRERCESRNLHGKVATPENDMAWPYSDTNTRDLTSNVGGFMNQYSQRTIVNPPQQIEFDMGTPNALSLVQALPQAESQVTWSPAGDQMMNFNRSIPQTQIPATPGNVSQQADTHMMSQYGSEAGSPNPLENLEHLRQVAENAGFELTPKSRSSKRHNSKRKHAEGYDINCPRCQSVKDKPCEFK